MQAVKDVARTFGTSGEQRSELGSEDFADVHSLAETRMFNLQCWIYGADSLLYRMAGSVDEENAKRTLHRLESARADVLAGIHGEGAGT